MKILHLTLKKNWFELIASGKKTTEYREYKLYWERRLLKKKFDEVHFRNGYSKNSPFMRVVCKGIAVVPPTGGLLFKPTNNEKLNGWQFAISLGTILELKYNKSLELTGEGRAASGVSEYSIDRAPLLSSGRSLQ